MKYPIQGFDQKSQGDKTGMVYPSANMNKKVIALDTANPLFELPVDGDFVYCDIQSTGLISIQINDMAMPPLPFQANMALRGFPYKKLILSWTAQPGLIANLWYGYGAEIIPPNQNITAIGSITNPVQLVHDDARWYLFGDFETQQGFSFIWGANAGPVAAQNSILQIFNPVGSGKIIYVDKIAVSDSTATDRIELRQHNAALVGLLQTGQFPKNILGVAGTAQLRGGASAAGAGTVIDAKNCLVNAITEWNFKAPLRLTEGEGIHVDNFTVNHLLLGSFEWRERTT